MIFSALLTLTFTVVTVTPSNAADQSTDTGIVLETMDAADYTYMKVQKDKDSVWVAMPATKVKKGTKVHYALGLVMHDFKSKSLGRTFTKVIFSPGLVSDTSSSAQVHGTTISTESSSFTDAVKNEAQQQATTPSQMQGSTGSAGATVPFIEDSIAPATGENSYTVADIFAKAKQLNGETVRVRGKVVKVNLNIMGTNWIHIQDGTGDPMQNSHDLVVTSGAEPELDQVVLIEGTLAADKDFGYGYKYDVLIEEAVLVE